MCIRDRGIGDPQHPGHPSDILISEIPILQRPAGGGNINPVSYTHLDVYKRQLEYEVKFWVDTTEYEYTVDGATGDIRKSEREPHPSASSADIGQEQAVSIALAHAGLSQSQVYGLEAEREREDDHLEYQVEFKAGGMEYSYDIAASDGAILSFEREKD